jgi:hypothetical protein
MKKRNIAQTDPPSRGPQKVEFLPFALGGDSRKGTHECFSIKKIFYYLDACSFGLVVSTYLRLFIFSLKNTLNLQEKQVFVNGKPLGFAKGLNFPIYFFVYLLPSIETYICIIYTCPNIAISTIYIFNVYWDVILSLNKKNTQN